MFNFQRLNGRSWSIDINEGGRGFIFALHYWEQVEKPWFLYLAFWFTPRLNGRKAWFW